MILSSNPKNIFAVQDALQNIPNGGYYHGLNSTNYLFFASSNILLDPRGMRVGGFAVFKKGIV